MFDTNQVYFTESLVNDVTILLNDKKNPSIRGGELVRIQERALIAGIGGELFEQLLHQEANLQGLALPRGIAQN